jgi:hypothetical protein
MAGPDPDHRAEAVRAYQRLLGEVAEDQVVAAAEDVITDVWIAELEQGRREIMACAEEDEADLHKVCLVLDALDAEIERVCLVGVERSRRGREELSRLRAAWADAYGR